VLATLLSKYSLLGLIFLPCCRGCSSAGPCGAELVFFTWANILALLQAQLAAEEALKQEHASACEAMKREHSAALAAEAAAAQAREGEMGAVSRQCADLRSDKEMLAASVALLNRKLEECEALVAREVEERQREVGSAFHILLSLSRARARSRSLFLSLSLSRSRSRSRSLARGAESATRLLCAFVLM